MNGMIKYGDLSTKIRVMKGKMLTRQDYDQMMQKKSVREVALYLKHNTYYKDDLETIDENEVHRGQLEILLYRAVVRDALKIAKHLTGNEKKIYRYVYRRLETDDVKKMLRTLQMGKPVSEVDRSTLFVSRYSKIDFNKSLEAKNVSELVESLKDTNFYKILKPLINDKGDIDIFSAEMALDFYYYQKTSDQVKKLSEGRDRDIFQMMHGLDVDFRNIYFILRAKKHYDLSNELIRRYIIPVRYKLHRTQLNEMIECFNLEELLKVIDRTFYGKIIDFRQEKVEVQFLSYMYKLQERAMRNEPYTIAPVIGYMYLKQIEVMNITNIIEGIRYSVEPDKIEDYLFGIKKWEGGI